MAKADKGDAGTDKPRFDFYKILPGVEEPKVQADGKKAPDRAVVEQAKERASDKGAPKVGDKATEKVAAAEATPADQAGRAILAAGRFVLHRSRCREPEGAARVRRLAG